MSQINVLLEAITKHPLHREIHYKTLAFCRTRRTLAQIEAEIATYTEFQQATQSQYHLICTLEEAYGLERFDLDVQGNPVSQDQKSGLSEDELDALVVDYAFQATDEGNEVVDQHSPKDRLFELMGIIPQRQESYVELLEFCKNEPRTYAEINTLFSGRDVLVRDYDGSTQCIQPSVFLDKLERAAGVEWKDGWVLTGGGKEFLEDLKNDIRRDRKF